MAIILLYTRHNERYHVPSIVHAITTGNRLVMAFERFVFRASYLTARGGYIKTGLPKRPRARTIKY